VREHPGGNLFHLRRILSLLIQTDVVYPRIPTHSLFRQKFHAACTASTPGLTSAQNGVAFSAPLSMYFYIVQGFRTKYIKAFCNQDQIVYPQVMVQGQGTSISRIILLNLIDGRQLRLHHTCRGCVAATGW
jgi:hypothetical protein